MLADGVLTRLLFRSDKKFSWSKSSKRMKLATRNVKRINNSSRDSRMLTSVSKVQTIP